MTLFLIVAGLLLALVLAALLRPLLRGGRDGTADPAKARDLNLAVLREQRAELERERAEGLIDAEAFGKTLQELERRTLEDAAVAGGKSILSARRPLVAGVLGILILAGVVALYVFLGQPGAMNGGNPAATVQGGGHAVTPQQITAMVEKLAARLQENPNDGEGWLMLARSYSALGRYPESAAAYGRAISMLPPDAQTLADFADTVAMAQGRKLQGEPEKIVRRALEVDPKNIKALALAGTIAFDRQDYQAAIGEWRKIVALVPADSGIAAGIQSSIRDAENRLAIASGKSESSDAKAPSAAATISGSVTIDPALASAVAPGDTLFIFARAVNGPNIPLAIMRKAAGDLPIKFTLDDSMSMAPNFRLSQFKQVVVGARISKSGDAMPRSGDLEGVSATVSPGAAGVRISIAHKVK